MAYTEECHEVAEAFWQEFRWLVRKTLDKVPEEDELDLRYHIGDATSVFHPGIPKRGEEKPSLLT